MNVKQMIDDLSKQILPSHNILGGFILIFSIYLVWKVLFQKNDFLNLFKVFKDFLSKSWNGFFGVFLVTSVIVFFIKMKIEDKIYILIILVSLFISIIIALTLLKYLYNLISCITLFLLRSYITKKIHQSSANFFFVGRSFYDLPFPIRFIVSSSCFDFFLKNYIIKNFKELEKEFYFLKKISNIEEAELLNSKKIDRLTGSKFEELTKEHYELEGYDMKLIGGKNDYAVDLSGKNIKNGHVIAIQCKRYKKNRSVRSSYVQQFSGASRLKEYEDHDLIFITTSYLTKDAKEYARKTNIKVIERDDLFSMFAETVLNNNNIELLRRWKSFCLNSSLEKFIKFVYEINMKYNNEKRFFLNHLKG